MLTHPDHQKVTSRQMRINMITGERTEEKQDSVHDSIHDSIPDSNSNSNNEDCFIQFGHYHYRRRDNGIVDQKFKVPVVVESIADLNTTIQRWLFTN